MNKTLTHTACALLLASFGLAAQASTNAQNTDIRNGGSINTGPDATADSPIFTVVNQESSRAELRFATFTSGSHSLEGTVKLIKLSGGKTSLAQTFSETGGNPISQLAIDESGYFYEVQRSTGDSSSERSCGLPKLAVGSTAKIKLVYDVSKGTSTSYVNGSKCKTITKSGWTKLYTKIGAYQTASGSGTVSVQWTNFTVK
ncbi:hypothetical protein VVD49_20400 [Uliginosibacterium sp. H3]|uniref:Alginate lyase n=1 Tax=Uliginosibacterium silvisoli TaxID=3114758 RepID=A0ABU6K9J9_9RHOO|nr:hypothetical protein [Uliginosibacterium sp. H3]